MTMFLLSPLPPRLAFSQPSLCVEKGYFENWIIAVGVERHAQPEIRHARNVGKKAHRPLPALCGGFGHKTLTQGMSLTSRNESPAPQ